MHLFYVLGTAVKVYPIKSSERFGKLCKLLLKEDVEKSTRNSQLAVISTFLLGDLANEGSRICEGDHVVLAEVIVECSPTGEHQFQLIVWREKSQASIWVINNKGKVRANTTGGMATTSSDGVEAEKIATNNKQTADNYDFSSDSDEDLFALCESDFSKSTSKDGKETSEQTRQKVFEKRKGKVYLRPKGVTPSTSHVQRSSSNLAVLVVKGEAKMAMKTGNVNSKSKSRKESSDSFKNVSSETCTGTTPAANVSMPNEVEEVEITTNYKKTADNYDFRSDSDEDLFESCENGLSKSTSKDGKDASEQTKQKVFGKKTGKLHLGPKGVSPSTLHVKKSFGNLAVLLDKGEANMALKSANVRSKDKSRKENICTEKCTDTKPVPNASVPNEVEEAAITTNSKETTDDSNFYCHFSSDSDEDLFTSCENGFSKSTSKDGKETNEKTKQKVFEKRSFSNLAVLLDKGEAKMAMKTVDARSKGKSRKESCDPFKNISSETCTGTTPVPNGSVPNTGSRNAGAPCSGTPSAVTSNAGTGTPNASTPREGTSNAGVPNARAPSASTPNLRRPNAGLTAGVGNTSHTPPASRHVPTSRQSLTMCQKTGPGSGTGSLRVSIQSTSPDKRSTTQFTHKEVTPTRKSTRIRNGDLLEGRARDKSRMSTVCNDLPQLGATPARCLSPKICEEDNSLETGTNGFVIA